MLANNLCSALQQLLYLHKHNTCVNNSSFTSTPEIWSTLKVIVFASWQAQIVQDQDSLTKQGDHIPTTGASISRIITSIAGLRYDGASRHATRDIPADHSRTRIHDWHAEGLEVSPSLS